MNLKPAPSLYLQVCEQLRYRQAFMNMTCRDVDDRAGLADGHYSKMVIPDTPAGRLGSWQSMHWAASALFPSGFRVLLVPVEPWSPAPREAYVPRGRPGHPETRPREEVQHDQ